MAITFPAVFQSSIATDPAATTAGYLTPARHNAGCAPAGLTTGRILVPSSATAFTDSADFTFNVSTGVLTLGGSTPGASVVVTGGTITASSPLFSGTQTRNNAAVTFDGWNLTVTDTAAAAGSTYLKILGGDGTKQYLSMTKALFQYGSAGSPGATEFRVDSNGGAASTISWYVGGTKWGSIFASGNNLLARPEQGSFVVAPQGTTAMTVSTTAVTVASGLDLLVGNAFVGTPQVATGSIIIKDSTGTAYKVSCNL